MAKQPQSTGQSVVQQSVARALRMRRLLSSAKMCAQHRSRTCITGHSCGLASHAGAAARTHLLQYQLSTVRAALPCDSKRCILLAQGAELNALVFSS